MPEETKNTLAEEITKQQDAMAERSEEEEAQRLQQMIEAKFQRDRQKCWDEISQVLNKYKMRFDIVTLLRTGSISYNIDLVKAPETQPQNPQN